MLLRVHDSDAFCDIITSIGIFPLLLLFFAGFDDDVVDLLGLLFPTLLRQNRYNCVHALYIKEGEIGP